MSKILVAYATNSGSTREVANTIAEEWVNAGHTVDVRRCREVDRLDGYATVIVGAPMIFGWHAEALRFVRMYRAELAVRKTALFACAMRLTLPELVNASSLAMTIDPDLGEKPAKSGSLSLKERFTTLDYYLKPMLKAASGVHVDNLAFFKGKLEMYRLKWWQAAFVMLVVQAPPGDYRNWDFIRSWANSIFAD